MASLTGNQRDLGTLQGPLLLFGGPYGNLEATRAMRRTAEARGIPPRRVICNGDLTAYCASPVETVALIREWDIQLVMGNCEASLASDSDDCGCGFEQGSVCALNASKWFDYTNRRIGRSEREWMKQLPGALRFSLGQLTFLVVHGAPSRINRFVFPSTPREQKRAELDLAETEVVIGGHCGIPFGEQIDRRFWLNTGVIGLPANDGTPDGWYLLLETEGEQVRASWHRLSYDHRRASRRMGEAGLDTGYSQALINGRWPSLDILPPPEQRQQGIPLNPAKLWLA
ncbi:metallophosphoesterase family protein [Sedimenticola thiotaurini]|uniref:Diadenosine tetraphosphatase-like protein n=1 Tax=Sedimenticola thiotaurini TaxID=1543721 RepID=A0A0F7K1A8_9GAMM|nr:metallophosphoesterase family protein [Sedimenticola thiotaurini]AKH21667.1 diadenosine tetraphosphatase-like protein [Sedimenticola thiotaurini]